MGLVDSKTHSTFWRAGLAGFDSRRLRFLVVMSFIDMSESLHYKTIHVKC